MTATVWSTFGRRLVQLPGVSALITALGLGTAAFEDTGTSGNTLPFLDGANTWSATQRFQVNVNWFGSDTGASTVTNVTNKDARLYLPGYTNATDPVSALISQTTSSDYTSFYGGGSGVALAMTRHRFYTAAAINTLTGTERLQITSAGFITTVTACFGRSAPVTKTADFTVGAAENWLINNKSGSACTVTLPAASSFTGREIMIKNIQAQAVNSASSNVVPLAGGAAGTVIVSNTAGRWVTLVSDGTNWIAMQGVI